jgi:uncharacterized membrane protein YcaP (DUF421 family)
VEEYTFDLGRILFGDLPLLFVVEIALRTTIMLLYLLFLLRLLGKRSLAQFSLFEFVLIIALGSAVGDPMFYPNVPVLHGIIVITVVVFIERLLIWMTNRSHKMEDILEGSPQRLIDKGRFHLEGLNRASLSRNEIYMKLRLAGVEQLGQVKRAYLELNGEMSIFLFETGVIASGLPVFPESEIGEVEALAAFAPVSQSGKYACLYCGEVIPAEVGQAFPVCPRCQHKSWVEADHTGVQTVAKEAAPTS